ncbi:glucose/galactose MFS transporter [Brevundimonas sp.]|uniref:glucose/galactose MFS transporter n=1 Tax=Brevundimonas sp. TaxID=1871086 RepID=UPI0025C0ED38|nr:glucose/galactose MFS transporter [Brevundimonas sp.]
MTGPTQSGARGAGVAFAYVTTLFFAWGLATSLIDPLIAAVREVFDLNYAEALLTQSAWFTAYGLVSLPAAAVLARMGYARSIVGALGVMVLGALIVPLATLVDFYPGVLAALFVIAAGVTLLQVAANPLAAVLGPPKGSHFRLVLSQAFNSLGTVLGPLLGATVMLTGGVFAVGGVSVLASPKALILILMGVGLGLVAGVLIGALRRDVRGWIVVGLAAGLASGWMVFLHNYVGGLAAKPVAILPQVTAAAPVLAAHAAEARDATLRNIDAVFIGLAVFFGLLGVFIWSVRRRLEAPGARAEIVSSPLRALSSRWALFGAAAIFLYVGAEVAIGSLMTNFLHSNGALGLPIHDAGRLVALYWAGALMGRFAGSAFLTRVPASWLLSVCTVCAAVLCLVVTRSGGATAAFCALAVGLFNSIMFPAIFTLTLERSTASTSATSGLLCMAIVGGAVLPPLGGWVADQQGLNLAFAVPLAAYVLLTVFAVAAARTPARDEDVAEAPVGH